MKKYLFLFIAGLFLAVSLSAQLDRTRPPKPGPAPVINIGNYDMFTLSNGLKVIVVENHKTPVISWQLTLDVDPVMEGEAKGYVDLAGQLMRAGTRNRTKQAIDEEIDFIGASLSTFSTGLFGQSLTRHRDKLLSLMSDVLLNPVFPQEELDKVLTQSISALTASENDGNYIANNVISSVVYGKDHPYGEVVTKESLNNIKRDQLVGYYNTYFRPNAAYLVIVGDITTKEAKKLSKKYFSSWKKGDVPKHIYPTPQAPDANKVAFGSREGAVQSVLAVTYPINLKPGDPDAIKAGVMNSILGGGAFSGRLMQNLREDKAYTYGARSSLSSDRLVGSFSARTEVGNNVTDSALVEVLNEMTRMVKEKVDQPSLDLVKNFMNGSFARSLESPRTIANFALNIERYKLPKDYYATYLEKLAAVTVEDVYAMAGKYIRPENAWIVIAGNKDEVAPKLAGFSKNNEVLFFDSYGRKVEQSATDIPAGMTAERVIENYLKALGGSEKLKSVTEQVIKMSTEMQGMTLEMVSYHKMPGKILVTTSVGGNVMQKQVLNGDRGQVSAMGQKMELSGTQLEEMKTQARIFPELDYKSMGYEVSLTEIEAVEGKPAYKVKVTAPGGNSKTDFFDVASGLKVRTVASQQTQMGPMTVTASYSDYRETNGIKIPYAIKQSVGPQNIDLKVTAVEINGGISDDLFSLE
ncbi:MAG: M16 family metallopeptidase [Bacteroidota bacterium]